MAIVDHNGLPIAVDIYSASPHEVTLVIPLLNNGCLTKAKPERLIGDRAYDSDKLDQELDEDGIEMISPHRTNRSKPATQDGRVLRRYKRRWKIERLFAWLQTFRRIQVRYEHKHKNYLAFIHLGCLMILLRHL